MFDREHHDRIKLILSQMNHSLLNSANAYFGGGTAIVFALNGYRESLDIDFLCADRRGYAALREAFFHDQFSAFFNGSVRETGPFIANQYGIYGRIAVDHQRDVKFEIIQEPRIVLSGGLNQELGVLQLDQVSMFCEKLLANADRGLDNDFLSRDIIDLLMMQHFWGPIPQTAKDMAIEAYGPSVISAYERAKTSLGSRQYLDECCRQMDVSDQVKDTLIQMLGTNYRDDRLTGFDD